MRTRKIAAVVAAVVTAALLVGAGSALAGGGGGGRGGSLSQEATRLADMAAFKAAVAKNLGTTTAKLDAAVKASAKAQIDAAVDNDDITSAEATTLKQAIDDGTLPAIRFATASGVAKELGTTAANLNKAWDAAAKAQAKARVDKALAAGDITDEQAAAAKKQIDNATFKFGSGPGGHGKGGPGMGGPGGRDGGKGGRGGQGGFAPPGQGGGSSTQSKSLF